MDFWWGFGAGVAASAMACVFSAMALGWCIHIGGKKLKVMRAMEDAK